MKRNFGLVLACLALALTACETSTGVEDSEPEPPAPPQPSTGQVAFYTDVAALAPITVVVGGNTVRVTSAFSTAPTCGAGGTGTMTLSPGSHSYSASNTAGTTWNGTITVAAGGCLRFRLTGNVTPPPPPPGTPNFTTPVTMFQNLDGVLSTSTSNGRVGPFTLSRDTTLVLRFVADYQAQAAVIPSSQLTAFQNGGSFSGYGSFDRVTGTQTFRVPAGTYYLVVRNMQSASNRYRAELDFDINLRPEQGRTFTFVDLPLNAARSISAGSRTTVSFTIQSGYRYFLDGASIGLGSYIIDGRDASAFNAGNRVDYYADYGGEDGAYPGLWELKLPPGTYALAISNAENKSNPIVYTMERWRIN